MNRKYIPWVALGGAFVVAALALGGLSTPALYVLIALACPLMMLWMMGNMRGGGRGGGTGKSTDDHNIRPTSSDGN
jgi:hypothetical protein